MELLNLKIATNKTPPFLNLTFHPGKILLRNSYVILLNQNVLSIIPKALNYLLDDEKRYQFHHVSLSLSDSSGNVYEIIKVDGNLSLRKNGRSLDMKWENFKTDLFLTKDIWESDKTTARAILGHYYVFPLSKNLYCKLNDGSFEEESKLKFIAEQIRELIRSCEYSFNGRLFAGIDTLQRVYPKLKPVHANYVALKHNCDSSFSRNIDYLDDTKNQVSILKKQIAILSNIEASRIDFTQKIALINEANKELLQVEETIASCMTYCQLEKIPDENDSPDWNISLQVLCYMNVLEQVVPTLEQLIQGFTPDIKQEDLQSIESRNTSVLTTLDRCINNINAKVQSTSFDINPSEEGVTETGYSWLEKVRTKLTPATDSQTKKTREEIHSTRHDLTDLLAELLHLRQTYLGNPLTAAAMPSNTLEFLDQSKQKLSNLKAHWSKIAASFGFPEAIGLAEFVQYVLKYHEMIAMEKKACRMREEITNLSKSFHNLQKSISDWQELTGSQKISNYDNIQLLISEANNLIRFKKDKERKLEELNSKCLESDFSGSLRRFLTTQLTALEGNWQAIMSEYGLDAVEISDPRLEPLFEKLALIQALNSLRSQVLNDKTDIAFAPEVLYPRINTWTLPDSDDSELHALLSEKTNALPKDTLNLFLSTNSNTNQLLLAGGFGHVKAKYIHDRDSFLTPRQTSLVADSAKAAVDFNHSKPLPKAPQPERNPAAARQTLTRKPVLDRLDKADAADKVKQVVELLNGLRNH